LLAADDHVIGGMEANVVIHKKSKSRSH